jgi:uncharacterized membrane protein
MQQQSTTHRIFSIDLLRGLVMTLMALDHVRDFFHDDAFLHEPLDLQTTTPFLFFTRFITHYCAPIFIFLAGVSAYLIGLKKSKAELSSFLIKRGFWLIIIEFAIVTFGWTFNPFYNVFVFQVIWAIGISMALMGLLVRLPYKVIFGTGLLIVLGHGLLTGITSGFWYDLTLGHFASYPISETRTILIIYSFVPWLGIMLCGYGMGIIFTPTFDPIQRKKILLSTGTAMLVLFILLRFSNLYGDPSPWIPQRNALYTFLSFINVSKYPASLLYTCITIGPALLLLVALEKARGPFVHIIAVFGRVPFFYYILHIYLIHILTIIAFYATGHTSADIVNPSTPFLFRPQIFGFSLPIVYLIWLGVLVILYPICKWYNHYKSKHKHWWLSYL